jgi:GH25 family lysozyme M1 (1,4-beta-N-acetylmuramidase)
VTKLACFTRPAARRSTVAAAVILAAAIPYAARAGSAPAAGPAAADGPTAVSGPMTHPDLDYAGWSLPSRAADPAVQAAAVTQTRGMDVSSHQGNVNWPAAAAAGGRFAYVKATESTTYRNPYFAQQYNGSYNAGLIRGAYHFALPDRSSGTAQADYFVGHGGGWSRDGRTLPPALDIEYNPYGAVCYGLSPAAMVSWIRAFSNQVRARTSRYPTIYTTRDWWVSCTGNSPAFGATNPLWIARYASSVGALPAGWSFHTIWQYASSGPLPGDQDLFNGAYARLQALATG